MNFLAHLYLSGDNDFVKIGNFIGDHVKGRKWEDYPIDIQTGILMHRKIDYFADHHRLVLLGKDRLKLYYGLYSGIIMDIFYDHLLAVNWLRYSNISLNKFSGNTYFMLLQHFQILPKRVKEFLPFMIINRRLQSYATVDGIRHSLNIMSNHSSLPNHTDFAIEILERYYSDYQIEFDAFFNEIQFYIKNEYC